MSNFIEIIAQKYKVEAAPIDEADMESDYADIYEIVGDYCNSAKFSSKIKEMKEEVLREISDKTKLKAKDEVRRAFDGVTEISWLIEKMFGEYLSNAGKIES